LLWVFESNAGCPRRVIGSHCSNGHERQTATNVKPPRTTWRARFSIERGPLSWCKVTGIEGLNSSNIDSAGRRIDPTQFDRLYVDIYYGGVD
jgi:hypothetical protein